MPSHYCLCEKIELDENVEYQKVQYENHFINLVISKEGHFVMFSPTFFPDEVTLFRSFYNIDINYCLSVFIFTMVSSQAIKRSEYMLFFG